MFSFMGAEYSFRSPEFFSLIFIFTAGAAICGTFIAIREMKARRGRIGGLFLMSARWCLILPLFIALLTLLLAGPQYVAGDIFRYLMHGKVILLIDGSPSMGAADVPDVFKKGVLPTRLALCTESLAEAFRGVSGLEVFPMVFTEATTFRSGNWIQLRSDTEAQFAGMLRSLQPAWIGAGTNPIRALSEATEELGNEPDLMIFCSDGETEYDPDEIIGWARSFGRRPQKYIPIYTLGAGTPNRPDPIPESGPDKNVRKYVRSPIDNSIVFTEFNSQILRNIAEETRGDYRHLDHLTDARDMLRSVLLRSFREGNRGGVRVEHPEDLTFPILIAAFVLLLFLTKWFAWLKAIGAFMRRA